VLGEEKKKMIKALVKDNEASLQNAKGSFTDLITGTQPVINCSLPLLVTNNTKPFFQVREAVSYFYCMAPLVQARP